MRGKFPQAKIMISGEKESSILIEHLIRRNLILLMESDNDTDCIYYHVTSVFFFFYFEIG